VVVPLELAKVQRHYQGSVCGQTIKPLRTIVVDAPVIRRNRRRATFVPPAATMDDKSLNLWRQIEGARRVGKRQAVARTDDGRAPYPHRIVGRATSKGESA